MKNSLYKKKIEEYYRFLFVDLGFKIKQIETHNYALYAKLISNKVGIYLSFEFRDAIPRIQLTKTGDVDVKMRVGYYTMVELYKEKDFVMHSFCLDEIMTREGKNYVDYFKDIKSIEESLKISSVLLEKYAYDLLRGDSGSYIEMDFWYRKRVENAESK